MSDPIVYIDRSRIREGCREEVLLATRRLVEFVEEHEPQLLAYAFSVDEADEMTLVAVHPDSRSLEYHMDIGAPEFREFAELIELEGIEVFGDPSPGVVDRLEAKATMLGDGAEVSIRPRHAGFSRLEGASTD